ncbi:membrane protein [Gordoniibacillus kamchatkensis]|uniref:Membrane protein n=1 Tax=Gordoniibacillus kamchatkensis TaxID=1590651 RepID=A0ABR5AFH3_9BACL|nr:membrane protein [Paenibacillus sp. VKM B-2647]
MLSALTSLHPIVLSLLFGTVLARAASSMSLPFLAIYLAKTTQMSPTLIGVVAGAGPLAGTLGGFFGGALSDRFGRRVIMLAALFGWAGVFVGFSLAKLPLVFLLLSAVNGLCRSFYEPVSQALMADLTPKEQRFRVFSMRYLAINIGVAVGPLLGAFFGLKSSALPFLLTGLVYFVYAVSLYVLLLAFGIKRIEGEAKSNVTIGSAWHVIRRDGALRCYLGGSMIGAIGYSQMTVTLSQYVEGRFAAGAMLFAVLMTVNAITVILLQVPLVRWAERRRSPLIAIAAGNVMFALGDIGFAVSGSPAAMIVSMAVFTLGEILNYPSANMLIDRIAPEGMRGTYYGAQTFGSLGQFVGPWLGGMLLTAIGGGPMFMIMAAVTLSATSLYWKGSRISMEMGLKA